jgi:S1-C subfamily serine protease
MVVSVGALVLGACGGSATCPQAKVAAPEVRPITADLPMAEKQKEATIMIEAALPDDVKAAFEKSVTESPVIPDDWGAAGVEWTSRGSGFFVKSANGKLFAITNHHVVQGATEVTLKLTEHIMLTGSPVIFADDRHDIAVVGLPDNIPQGLFEAIHPSDLASRAATNQESVDASGFPRVADDQSYRLTSGTVSNATFTFKIDGADEPFIQHTASIDHGNSGGPLFRHGTGDVLGMNTLSIPMDNNLFCAVPASTIAKAVSDAQVVPDPTNVAQSKKSINDTCTEILQEVTMAGEPPEHTTAILSDQLIAEKGIPAFDARAQGDHGALLQLMMAIRTGQIMSFLRPIVLGRMAADVSDLGPAKCKEANINQTDLRDYKAQKQVRQRVDFANQAFRTFFWRLEQGHWRIIGYQ